MRWAVSFVIGAIMLAISFLVPGTTRDLILRVAGGLAILAGVVMVVTRRRG